MGHSFRPSQYGAYALKNIRSLADRLHDESLYPVVRPPGGCHFARRRFTIEDMSLPSA